MKKFIGLFILVIALVVISGCTQPTQPVAVTTTVATPVPTVPPTIPPTVATPVPTIMPTTVATVLSTPKITLVPQTKKTIFYMRNNTFVPTELTVLPGTGISWVNEDSIDHSVNTIGIHASTFKSGIIIPGASSGNTFADEGVFEFACPDHPDMKGKIVVKAGPSVEGAPTIQASSK